MNHAYAPATRPRRNRTKPDLRIHINVINEIERVFKRLPIELTQLHDANDYMKHNT
jgi:hypothetical protein